jgi:hypothetical protein
MKFDVFCISLGGTIQSLMFLNGVELSASYTRASPRLAVHISSLLSGDVIHPRNPAITATLSGVSVRGVTLRVILIIIQCTCNVTPKSIIHGTIQSHDTLNLIRRR